jgi:hypothetical protein
MSLLENEAFVRGVSCAWCAAPTTPSRSRRNMRAARPRSHLYLVKLSLRAVCTRPAVSGSRLTLAAVMFATGLLRADSFNAGLNMKRNKQTVGERARRRRSLTRIFRWREGVCEPWRKYYGNTDARLRAAVPQDVPKRNVARQSNDVGGSEPSMSFQRVCAERRSFLVLVGSTALRT